MENDPTSSRNTIEPPAASGDAATIVDEEDADGGLEELAALDDAFLNEETNPFEFNAINNQLDQLQSALDEIESRNANIHKELLEILFSNREVRKNIREELTVDPAVVPTDPPSSNSAVDANSSEAESSKEENSTVLDRAGSLMSDVSSMETLLNSVMADMQKNL